ncbi:hypothetical protein [Streptomyces canus]|uniref:hypothetical protein n=1 Tax=Streptomyces canus TaxID=58343 RepID=UPI0033B4C240
MMAATAVGVPQLTLPRGADHFVNAEAAESHGFAVREEIAALLAPADLVGDLENLAVAAR